MPTENQIAANRQNAALSTGPQTTEGKSRARLNALRHGLRSQPHISSSEDSEGYESLLLSFRETFDPQDAFEDHLVSSVAAACWRRERALRAEAESLNLSVQSVESSLQTEQLGRLSVVTEKLAEAQTIGARIATLEVARALFPTLLTFSCGCDWILDRLEILKTQMALGCETKSAIAESLGMHFAADDSKLGRRALELALRRSGGETAEPSAEDMATIDKLLTERVEQIQRIRQSLLERERLEVARRRVAVALPEPEMLGKILRYEKTIVNHLYRDLAELERRRRVRNGERVPAPVSIAVTSEG
jgi:hypothetical protein